MADSVVVSTYFELRDRMSSGLANIGRQVDGVKDKVASAVQGFSGLGAAIGAIGAAFGGAALLRDVVKVNEEFENTSIRIAGTLKAFDMAPTIGVAQMQAQRAIKVIQDMAAVLPGETEEYVSVFATALPKAVAAGMRNTTDIAKMTSSWMALASSNIVDAQQAGMDLFRMLSGQAGADVRMFTILAEKIGMTADEYNKIVKANPAKAVVLIQKAMADYADQQMLAAGGMSAKMGELQSRLKELQLLAGQLFFDRAKKAVEDINAWLEKNKQVLVYIGSILLGHVADGLSQALEFAKYMAFNMDTILRISKAVVAVWVAGSLAGALSNLVMLFRSITTAAEAASIATTTAMGSTGMRSLATLGTAAVAGLAVALWPSDAGSSQEQAWEKANREAMEREIEMRAKYADIIGELNRRMQGVPTVGGALTVGVLKELYRELSGKLTQPLADEARQKVSQQRIALAEYATLKGFDIGEFLDAPEVRAHIEAEKKKKAPKGRTQHVTNFYNSRFDIKQEFAEGFDPDRIAVAFSQDLARLGEMKLQSGYAPLFAGH